MVEFFQHMDKTGQVRLTLNATKRPVICNEKEVCVIILHRKAAHKPGKGRGYFKTGRQRNQ